MSVGEELLHGWIGFVFAAAWGAVWGSFFTLAVHRLGAAAAEDESETWLGSARHALRSLVRLWRPGSRCPACQAPLRWHENLPVVGWLRLGGCCAHCGKPISPRYLVVELASVALALAVHARFLGDASPGPLPFVRFFVYFFFCGTLLVLTAIDFEKLLLPLAITLPAIPGFFLAGRLLPDVPLTDALIGGGLGFGGLWLLRRGYKALTGRDGLGGGDEMLVALIGGFLGWRALPYTLFLGATSGLLVAVPALLITRRRAPGADAPLRHAEVPFGPFLAFGAFVYLFCEPLFNRVLADLATRGL